MQWCKYLVSINMDVPGCTQHFFCNISETFTCGLAEKEVEVAYA